MGIKLEFSVLMSVYRNDNAKHFIKAVKSVIKQTVKPSEIVIVIDGKIGNELIQAIEKVKKIEIVSVFSLCENKGLGFALAYGMKKCKYDIIARMDSDDICSPKRFEKQLCCFMDNPNLAVIGGYVQEFTENLQHLKGIKKVPITDKDIKKYAKFRCPFNHPTIMFRKQAVMEAGGYKSFLYNEDYFLWIRMIEKEQLFKNLNCILVYMRVDSNTYKRRGGYKYFKSEYKIQKYMLCNKLICYPVFLFNISNRFIIQLLFPNTLRQWVYKNLLRVNI